MATFLPFSVLALHLVGGKSCPGERTSRMAEITCSGNNVLTGRKTAYMDVENHEGTHPSLDEEASDVVLCHCCRREICKHLWITRMTDFRHDELSRGSGHTRRRFAPRDQGPGTKQLNR